MVLVTLVCLVVSCRAVQGCGVCRVGVRACVRACVCVLCVCVHGVQLGLLFVLCT